MKLINNKIIENALEKEVSCEGISDFLGKIFSKIEKTENDDYLNFYTSDKLTRYVMYHSQDCCESVYIEDIIGDLDNLIGNPILLAEEAISYDLQEWQNEKDYFESFTWTFYKLATIKGYVTIRWFGSSNGYYSETVDIVKYIKDI